MFAHFLSYDILLTYSSCFYVTDINPLMLVSNIFFLFVLKKKKLIYLFIWPHCVLVAAYQIFSWGMQSLSCGM